MNKKVCVAVPHSDGCRSRKVSPAGALLNRQRFPEGWLFREAVAPNRGKNWICLPHLIFGDSACLSRRPVLAASSVKLADNWYPGLDSGLHRPCTDPQIAIFVSQIFDQTAWGEKLHPILHRLFASGAHCGLLPVIR